MLKINEIFYSIQGESSFAGQPCVFVRLTYCNLRCTYCDTEYAFYEGYESDIEKTIEIIRQYDCKLVEITGGEPLIQHEVHDLMTRLCDEGFTVLLETGGSLPVATVDKRVKIIMDLKTPSSGMEKKNRYTNLPMLKEEDEIKFVIGTREDYDWAKNIIDEHNLAGKFIILFSVVFGSLTPLELSEWILEDKLNFVRFQLQMHKFIWEPDKRGV